MWHSRDEIHQTTIFEYSMPAYRGLLLFYIFPSLHSYQPYSSTANSRLLAFLSLCLAMRTFHRTPDTLWQVHIDRNLRPPCLSTNCLQNRNLAQLQDIL